MFLGPVAVGFGRDESLRTTHHSGAGGASALAASLSSLYVHYQLLHDPSYASPCDISETVSCQAVLESSYCDRRRRSSGRRRRNLVGAGPPARRPRAGIARTGIEQSAAAGYTFVLSVFGLAAVFYFGYASFFVIGKLCVLCATMYVAVIGVFLVVEQRASQSHCHVAGPPLSATCAPSSRGRSPPHSPFCGWSGRCR